MEHLCQQRSLEVDELREILTNLQGDNIRAISPYMKPTDPESWVAWRLANLMWGPL